MNRRDVFQLTALDQGAIESGHQFFNQAESLIANVDYNTVVGYRELHKGGRVPQTFGRRD